MRLNFYKILNYIQPVRRKTVSKLRENDRKDLQIWLQTGLKVPPPDVVKNNVIRKYKKKQNIKTIIGMGQFFNERKLLFKEDFKYVLDLPVITSNPSKQQILIEFEQLNVLIGELGQTAIFWLDTKALFNCANISEAEGVIKKLIEIILKPICFTKLHTKFEIQKSFNHTLLFDDALLYYKKNTLPSVLEIKQWLIRVKPGYGNIKTENNVFVFSQKL